MIKLDDKSLQRIKDIALTLYKDKVVLNSDTHTALCWTESVLAELNRLGIVVNVTVPQLDVTKKID